MQVNQKPKITIDEDYLDLRDQSETLDNKTSTKGKKSFSKKRKSPVRTLNLQNEGLRYEKELINCGLKKLVTSYNTTANQHQRSYGAKRKNCNRENTVCDPRFRRYVETEDKCLKSQSELSVSAKKLDIDPVSSSTPLFYRKKKPNKYSNETESVKNSAALNKDSHENLNVSKENTLKHAHSRPTDFDNIETEIGTIDGVNAYKNVERSQNDPLNRDIDPRLVNKYSILKGPWKRSWTIPVFASRYNLTNKNQCDNSDRQTYLYDEGSDLDSSYVEIKHHQCFLKTGVPSQLMAILFVLGAACGIFLASILIYLIFGNNLIQFFFKPREVPETSFKSYFKFVGGGIIYVITSIVSTVARVLSIPTQNVYEPAIHYK